MWIMDLYYILRDYYGIILIYYIKLPRRQAKRTHLTGLPWFIYYYEYILKTYYIMRNTKEKKNTPIVCHNYL